MTDTHYHCIIIDTGVVIKGVQGRRQTNFHWATEKTKPKNSTIKPPSTLSVSCTKMQTADAYEGVL